MGPLVRDFAEAHPLCFVLRPRPSSCCARPTPHRGTPNSVEPDGFYELTLRQASCLVAAFEEVLA